MAAPGRRTTVKTRTLIALAVVTGAAILIAGILQIWIARG